MTSYMTIPVFAGVLGVSRKTVERLIADGKIKAVRKNPLAGRTSPFLIPKDEVQRFLKRRNEQAKS